MKYFRRKGALPVNELDYAGIKRQRTLTASSPSAEQFLNFLYFSVKRCSWDELVLAKLAPTLLGKSCWL